MRSAIAHTLGFNVLQVICGIAISILTARVFGAEGKGILSVYSFNVGLIVSVLCLGVPSSVVYFRSQDKISDKDVLFIATAQFGAFIILYSFAVAIGLWAGLLPYSTSLDSFFLSAYPLSVGVAIASNYITAAMQSRLQFKVLNYLGFFGSMISAITIAALFVVQLHNEASIVVFVLMPLAFSVISLSLVAVAGWRASKAPAKTSFDRQSFKSIVMFGLANFLADLLQMISYRIDIWFVAYYAGLAAVGQYTLAVGLAQYLWIVPKAVAGVVFPSVSASAQSADEETIKLAQVAFALSIAMAAAAAVVAPTIVPAVFGQQFMGSAPAFSALLIGVVPFVPATIYASLLAGKGRINDNLWASGVGFVVTVALDVLLIPRWGIFGAALASSASYLATSLVVFYCVSHVLGRAPTSLLLFPLSSLKRKKTS